jgi:apolipoprotein N-acyltransferase
MKMSSNNSVAQVSQREFWVRTIIGLALAAASAAMITLSFAPYNLWPLIWIGFVPGLLAQFRIMPKRLSGLAAGVYVGGFIWGYLGPVFADGIWYMKYLWLIIGVIVTLVTMGTIAFHERTRYRWFVLQGVAGWVGVEMIRIFIPVAGTWGFVGYALYQQPWLIQPVSVFGIFGLDVLIMLVNYALAQGAVLLYDRFRPDETRIPVQTSLATRWLIGVGVALVAWTGLSLALFRTPTTPTLRVAAIQLARPPSPSFSSDEEFRQFLENDWRRLIDDSRQAAAQGAQLIVWPEEALPFDPQVAHTDELRALAAETGAYLAMGYNVMTAEGRRNEATVLAPDGAFLGVYGKEHPTYMRGEESITAGTFPAYDTSLGKLGTIICYDFAFTDSARDVAANGAQIIAAPSWDWPAIATKNYAHPLFRAVENRVALIKADCGYDSAIIDPYGRIIARDVSPEPNVAMLVADVPVGRSNALQTWLGDWIGWLALAGMVFFTVFDTVTARKEKETQQ